MVIASRRHAALVVEDFTQEDAVSQQTREVTDQSHHDCYPQRPNRVTKSFTSVRNEADRVGAM
jgi:hypothetical protein